MAKAQVFPLKAFVKRGWTATGRVELPSGALALQADISAIAMTVKRRSTVAGGATTANGVALTVASVIFDTLQNDARWDKDATGYNFLYEVDGLTVFPNPDAYRVEFVFTPVAGKKFSLVYEGPAISTHN